MAVNPYTGQTSIDPRHALAMALMSQGMQQRNVRHPMEGMGQLANTAVGAMLMNKFMGDQQANNQNRNEALAGALQTAQGQPAETATYGNDTINWNATEGNDRAALAQLLTNPNTANMPITQQLLAAELAGGGQTFEPIMDANGNVIAQKDKTTGRVYADPRAPDLLTDAELEQKKAIRAAGRTTVNNKVDVAGETAEAKALGTQRADRYGKLQDAAGAARGKIRLYDQIESGMDNFETGSFGETRLVLSRAAEFFGIDPDKLGLEDAASGESISAAASKLAQLARAGDGEGTTLAGQMSDKDIEFLIAQNASLGKSARGNRLIIANQRRAAERVLEKEQFFNDWLDQNGNLKGAASAWSKWERNHPLFSEEDKKALSMATKSPSEMSIEELTNLDVTKLSAEELKAAQKRWDELQ